MAKKKAVTKSSVDEELDLIRKERDSILNFKIYDHEITIVKGPAGSGKSYVSVYAALDLLKNPDNGYEKIVFIYPVATNPDENIG